MVLCAATKLRLGLKIILDNAPCVVLDKEFVKPGKGQAFNRIRLRNLFSNRIIEKTFKSSDFVELADVKELYLIYSYRDNIFWYFIDPLTFEQTAVSFSIIKDHIKWLVEQVSYSVTLWNNQPICITPPNFINLKVVNTSPGIKGNTVSSITKLAISNTGAVIKVPLFIQMGEYIKVDTRSGVYISRINK